MRRNLIETILGGVVLAVAAFFLVFAYTNASIGTVEGTTYGASFDSIAGINPGSDVRMSGIKVGTVSTVAIDPKTYAAMIKFTVDSNIKLPVDTSAEVATEGLLGGKYLSLVPGADDKAIPPGGDIRYTQGPLNLEQVIGQLIFSNQAGKGGDKGGEGSGEKPQNPNGQNGQGAPQGSKAPGGPTL